MSETETVEVFTVQGYRRTARHAMSDASALISGRSGLTVEEQIEHIQQAKRGLLNAGNALDNALELIQTRDNAAWQASKGRNISSAADEASDDDADYGNDDEDDEDGDVPA